MSPIVSSHLSALARAAEQLLHDASPDGLADGLGDAVRQLRALVD
jgi:hypothetical protein